MNTPPFHLPLAAGVKALAAARGLTVNDLAARMGVPPSTLSSALKRGVPREGATHVGGVAQVTAEALAEALGVALGVILGEAEVSFRIEQ